MQRPKRPLPCKLLAKPLLPETKLPLMGTILVMAQEMIKEHGNEDEGDDAPEPLDYWSENYMESLSEAGYTECRPNDRLSSRAFARILRVEDKDLKTLKALLGYRRGDYHDFAIAEIVTDVLSRNDELAPALRLLKVGEDRKAKGPFYPSKKCFDLGPALEAAAGEAVGYGPVRLFERYAEDLQRRFGKKSADDEAVVKLAGLFCLETEQPLRELSQHFSGDRGQVLAAHAVLEAVRSQVRFTTGLNWIQPKPKAK